jgi:hypothetical protein
VVAVRTIQAIRKLNHNVRERSYHGLTTNAEFILDPHLPRGSTVIHECPPPGILVFSKAAAPKEAANELAAINGEPLFHSTSASGLGGILVKIAALEFDTS